MKWISKLAIIMAVLCVVQLMTGCSLQPDWEATDHGNGNGLVEYKDDGIPFKFEYTTAYDNLRNGKLIFTINKSWVVTNADDIPEEGGIRTDTGWLLYYDDQREDRTESYKYPDEVVLEDGSFIDGTYIIMVQMTVTSEDAENWTNEDVGANGQPKSWWQDPYIFEIPCALKVGNSRSYDTVYAYFSELWSVEAGNGYQYYLEPGQTKTIVFGWLIDEDRNTDEPYEVSKLRLRIALNGAYTEVFLPLGESELPE